MKQWSKRVMLIPVSRFSSRTWPSHSERTRPNVRAASNVQSGDDARLKLTIRVQVHHIPGFRSPSFRYTPPVDYISNEGERAPSRRRCRRLAARNFRDYAGRSATERCRQDRILESDRSVIAPEAKASRYDCTHTPEYTCVSLVTVI